MVNPGSRKLLSEGSYRALSLMLPPLALVLMFHSVLGFDYVWDDVYLFISSEKLRNWDLALTALFQPILPDSAYLRPLALLSFALEFHWAGVDSAVSHSINLAIHVLNTFMVCWLADHLLSSSGFASVARQWRVAIAGFFYGLHPAMIEPVAWVSSRFDLLVTFFTLLALVVESRIGAVRVRAPLLGLCFMAAACSKEMAVTFPALLFLYQRITRWRSLGWDEIPLRAWKDREWVSYALIFCLGLVFLWMRLHFMGRLSHSDNAAWAKFSMHAWLHPAFVAQTFMFYLRTIFWPFADLGPLHPFEISALGPTEAVTSLIGVALVLMVLGLGTVRGSAPLTLLTMCALALMPVLNISPLTIAGSIGHERFLVLPLTFVALALSLLPPPERWFVLEQKLLPKLFRMIGVAWLALAVANDRVTLPLWNNDLSLWGWNYQKHPDYWYSQYVYLGTLVNNNQLTRAGEISNDLLAKGPLDGYVQLAYGAYLEKSGDSKEAVNYLLGVLDSLPPLHAQGGTLGPDQSGALPISVFAVGNGYQTLAMAYLDLHEFHKGLDAANACLFYDPNNAYGMFFKSLALYSLDRPHEADDWYNRAYAVYMPERAKKSEGVRKTYLGKICRPAKWRPEKTCRLMRPLVSPNVPQSHATPRG